MSATKKFLNGTLSTIVLALLHENGKMYGYEICQRAKVATSDSISLTEGAIYPTLHKLEKEGLISSSKEVVNGRTRKYYAVNQQAIAAVENQIDLLSQFIAHLQSLLKPTVQ